MVPALLLTTACVWTLVAMAAAHGHGSSERYFSMALIGILCGVGATMLIVGPAFFVVRLMTRPPELELEPGEVVLRRDRANHWLAGEARGGQLVVTDRRVAFCPHRFNVQLATWSADGASIEGVGSEAAGGAARAVRALAELQGVPTSAMVQSYLVVDVRGQRERFVVYDLQGWTHELERLRASAAAVRRAPTAG